MLAHAPPIPIKIINMLNRIATRISANVSPLTKNGDNTQRTPNTTVNMLKIRQTISTILQNIVVTSTT